MSRTRLAATLTAITLTFALTGCGSDSGADDTGSSGSADSTAAPAADASTGDTITGTSFTFKAPEGWKENDGSQLPSVKLLALAIDPDDKDGFADNVNILEDPTIVGFDDLDKLADNLTTVLEGAASDVSIDDPIDIDGEQAVVALATYPKYRTVQQVVAHAGKGYIMTYSFSPDVSEDDQLALAASVAASWKWAS